MHIWQESYSYRISHTWLIIGWKGSIELEQITLGWLQSEREVYCNDFQSAVTEGFECTKSYSSCTNSNKAMCFCTAPNGKNWKFRRTCTASWSRYCHSWDISASLTVKSNRSTSEILGNTYYILHDNTTWRSIWYVVVKCILIAYS